MKKVFIRTFGCQMNEYDSDKMADVLRAAEGYEPTTDVEQADLILFNTCSVREKAQEKVFSDLGRVKHLKKKGALIGVGGCVASQEGAAIIERAPYVDIVFGPQTLHRLPPVSYTHLDVYKRQAQDRLNSRGDRIAGNGLAAHGAIVRRGRKVLIDVHRYGNWLAGRPPVQA